MKNFGGSELVTAELAEFYASRGWSVTIYSPKIGEPLRSNIHPIITMTPTEPPLTGWDIIWDHHGLVINKLTRDSAKRIVCNHMSSYVDVEKPKYDVHKPDLILANSQETINSMPVGYQSKAKLFQNPAYPTFQNARVGAEYVLMISNHRPPEVDRMVELIGLPVVKIGEFDRFERVKPNHFHGAAFVVCNGKSVQMALRAQCPVFLYDHFGGPGWLTKDNFKLAEHFNFSGRGFHEPLEEGIMNMWPGVMPIRRVNWRYKLEEWLYYHELI
jgi:hypothetical protein